MLNLGCLPFYVVAEKKYALSGRLVETFLDPLYNDNILNGFSWDRQTKIQLANSLCQVLDDVVVNKFHEAYRFGEVKRFIEAYEFVTNNLSHISPELVECIDGCRVHLNEIAEEEASSSENCAYKTINIPSLISLLRLLNRFANIRNMKMNVIHDEQSVYEKSYKDIVDKMKNASKNDMTMLDGTDCNLNLNNIESFKMKKSHGSLLLQAADILAGAVREIFCAINHGKKLDEFNKELGDILLPLILIEDLGVTYLMCSDLMLNKINVCYFSHFKDELECNIEQSNKSLETIFPFGFFENSEEAYKLKIPLYISESSLNLLPEISRPEKDCAFPIFTTYSDAQDFNNLIKHKRGNNVGKVLKFDVPELHRLILLLEEISQYVDIVSFDPTSHGRSCYMKLQHLKDAISSIINRQERIIQSGLQDKILKEHTTSIGIVKTALLSSGKYGAFQHPNDHVFGKTRDEALEKYLKSKL
jgi:hypothetical protein